MLFVTFHGGPAGDGEGAAEPEAAGKKKPPITQTNNIGAYDDTNGTQLSVDVLQGETGSLSELRGMAIVGPLKQLWVASGGKKASALWAFTGSGTSYGGAQTIIVQQAAGPGNGLSHPFDFTFDGSGQCYVSNQDTNVVLRLTGPAYTPSGAPALPLPSGDAYPNGTFVASTSGLPGKSSFAWVPPDAGLDFSTTTSGGKTTVSNSVRGLTWANGFLYVADEVGQAVKVYASSGLYLGKSHKFGATSKSGDPSGPVHLLYPAPTSSPGGDAYLYATTGDGNIYCTKLDATKPAHLDFAAVEGISGLDSPSGMTVDPSGNLYVASRKSQLLYVIEAFTTRGANKVKQLTQTPLPDRPEFVLWVPG